MEKNKKQLSGRDVFSLLMLAAVVVGILYTCSDSKDERAENTNIVDIQETKIDSTVSNIQATEFSVTIPQSKIEANFFQNFQCVDENECYTERKFERDFLKEYPDILKRKFAPSNDEKNDKELLEIRRGNFRRGLYMAKIIKLADGRTLFDFLTQCSKGFGNYSGAEIAFTPKDGTPYLYIQFFPTLRQKGSNDEFEMQILIDRVGDKVVARSPYFSTNILKNPDFMDRHGLECWHDFIKSEQEAEQ